MKTFDEAMRDKLAAKRDGSRESELMVANIRDTQSEIIESKEAQRFVEEVLLTMAKLHRTFGIDALLQICHVCLGAGVQVGIDMERSADCSASRSATAAETAPVVTPEDLS